MELWCTLDWAVPGCLGDRNIFKTEFQARRPRRRRRRARRGPSHPFHNRLPSSPPFPTRFPPTFPPFLHSLCVPRVSL